MEEQVRLFMALQFAVLGVSHIAQHRAWARFFEGLCARGTSGAFLNGFLTFTTGAFIVVFHNVWTGLPVVLTVIGCLQMVKGALCFVLPALALRSMSGVSVERSAKLAVAGGVLLVVAALMAGTVWFR